MKFLLSFIAFSILCGCQQSVKNASVENSDQTFYVGTYTNGESEGIYKYSLAANGTLQQIGLAAKTSNPSYLAWGPERKYLLAVSEVNRQGEGSGIKSFAVNRDSLVFISESSSGGTHPCFVAVNNNAFVLTANYTGGNVGLLNMDKDGRLSELLDLEQHTGKGTTSRQESPHAHSAWFVPGSKDIITVDLGTNELWFSSLDEALQKLSPSDPQTLAMPPGAGPRHLTIHPNGKWIYVVNELNCTVSIIEKSASTGYKIKSSISTLPLDFAEYNTAADIHISGDGKFLYTSNRGHNSIAIYKVEEEGASLSPLGHQSTHGNTPRNFSLSPDDHFLLVANQNSNNIVAFERNASSGLIKYIAETEAPSPVCILF